MSSAITTAGQTRINQLRGEELPLVIDRMVLALIPGLDPTLAVDRSQQMPAPADIVHTAIIDPDHKGYVNPDQVVYSIVLGSDIGDFSFNWIGLVEAVTNTVIAITTTPETPKRKTNLSNNTTGNNITRNFMIQFLDAQNLTGVTVAAETWQFDYQAAFAGHEALIVDPSQIGSIAKHVTSSQAKVWQDHADDPHDYAPFDGNAGQIFKAAPGAGGNDVVVKSQVASATATGLVELATAAEVQAGTDGVRAVTPAGLASRTATDARTGLVELATAAEVQAGTDTTRAVTAATLKTLLPKRAFGASDYIRIPDVPGGLIIQWGAATIPAASSLGIAWPIAFPALCCRAVCSHAQHSGGNAAIYSPTNTGAIMWNEDSGSSRLIAYIAIGY